MHRYISSAAAAAVLGCLRAPSDTVGGATTQTSLQQTTAAVEQVANVAGAIAAAEGGSIGKAADAALQGAEAVTSTVEQSLANHNSALQTAAAALKEVVAQAPTVAAAVSPDAAASVTAVSIKSTGLLAEIEKFFSLFSI